MIAGSVIRKAKGKALTLGLPMDRARKAARGQPYPHLT